MNFIDKKLEQYSISKSTGVSSICEEINHFTQQNLSMPQMITGPMEASFLGFLIKSLNVKKILEIGTFSGYSTLAMAESMDQDGKVITIDINEDTTKVAQDFWNKSAHGFKIHAIIGKAKEKINELDEFFDLIFIDADKENYLDYFKMSLEKLNDKGVILIDNVLWSGKVLNSKSADVQTKAIINLNNYIANRADLHSTLLPIRDGLFLVTKS